MILVDTGPLIALFDPLDGAHARCREALQQLQEPMRTTLPVLTEAFHILSPGSVGSDRLRDFIMKGGLSVWFFTDRALERAFELMHQYRDQTMNLADASLIVAAERPSDGARGSRSGMRSLWWGFPTSGWTRSNMPSCRTSWLRWGVCQICATPNH